MLLLFLMFYVSFVIKFQVIISAIIEAFLILNLSLGFRVISLRTKKVFKCLVDGQLSGVYKQKISCILKVKRYIDICDKSSCIH